MNKETKQTEITKDNTEIPPLTKEMVKLSEHQIRLENGKGNKWRTTVTPPLLSESMLELLPIKIPRTTLQYDFKQLSKKILGKPMSFHTLRHGFGNYQANVLKVSLPIVQQMMGHSRLDTTGIYTRANPEFAIQQSWNAMTGVK
jgi:integrase